MLFHPVSTCKIESKEKSAPSKNTLCSTWCYNYLYFFSLPLLYKMGEKIYWYSKNNTRLYGKNLWDLLQLADKNLRYFFTLKRFPFTSSLRYALEEEECLSRKIFSDKTLLSSSSDKIWTIFFVITFSYALIVDFPFLVQWSFTSFSSVSFLYCQNYFSRFFHLFFVKYRF